MARLFHEPLLFTPQKYQSLLGYSLELSKPLVVPNYKVRGVCGALHARNQSHHDFLSIPRHLPQSNVDMKAIPPSKDWRTESKCVSAVKNQVGCCGESGFESCSRISPRLLHQGGCG